MQEKLHPIMMVFNGLLITSKTDYNFAPRQNFRQNNLADIMANK